MVLDGYFGLLDMEIEFGLDKGKFEVGCLLVICDVWGIWMLVSDMSWYLELLERWFDVYCC